MGKNVLLVSPEFPKDTFWSFSGALELSGHKASMPPLGLLTVASMLPDDYNVRLVDMNVQPLTPGDIAWSDAVFTSTMVVQNKSLEDVIGLAASFGKPVVAGGPHPTEYWDKIVQRTNTNVHLVLGEAESGVLERFLHDWESGKLQRIYYFQPQRTKEREVAQDSDEMLGLERRFGDSGVLMQVPARPSLTVSPRLDLLKLDRYASMAVQQSRGCPYVCDFCNIPKLFGSQPRLKPTDVVIAELEALRQVGHRGFVFVVDDNYIGDIKGVRENLEAIADFQVRNNYPFALFTEADVRLGTDDVLLGLMRNAGFDMVFMGIETPNKDALKAMHKGQNLRVDLLKSVRNTQSYGIEVSAGFIIGSDNEPNNPGDAIYDFVQQAGIPTAMISLLTVIRGAPLYAKMVAQDRLLEECTGNNTSILASNFIPQRVLDQGFSRSDPRFQQTLEEVRNDIRREYVQLVNKLYDASGANYFDRCETLFSHLGETLLPTLKVNGRGVMTLAKSLWYQGFGHAESKEYRGFMWRNKGNLAQAVTRAAHFRHFRHIARVALQEYADIRQHAPLREYQKV